MHVIRWLLGSRNDWHLRQPRRPRLRLSLAAIGPWAIVATSVVGWFAFAGAQGPGSVALGLFVGAVSIMLMAWSFVLAVRPTVLERFFGGLDSMYRSHRWAGALSIFFMWLHTSIEPEIENGILGASRAVADAAEGLAETGQTMLYALVGLSVVRLFPYRWWRWTHKLLGVPFAFASWHFFTAEKTYANGSPWGIWFGAWMLIGLAAFVARVVGVDMIGRGARYTVVAAEHVGSTTRIELAPVSKPIGQHLGQFAFVKLDVPGMREPHPFTIASAPDNPNLEFYIRHLGDWSAQLPDHDLVGRSVRVEGPYGELEPYGRPDQPVLWVAGGVGATPFIAAADAIPPGDVVPTMLYAVRSTTDNPMLDRLQAAHDARRIRLHVFTSETGRMGPDDLDALFPRGLADHHVALCGPAGLISTMADAATERGAATIEHEDFDIRQGFGPDRSLDIDRAMRTAWNRRGDLVPTATQA